jgi:hypothetical protein
MVTRVLNLAMGVSGAILVPGATGATCQKLDLVRNDSRVISRLFLILILAMRHQMAPTQFLTIFFPSQVVEAPIRKSLEICKCSSHLFRESNL